MIIQSSRLLLKFLFWISVSVVNDVIGETGNCARIVGIEAEIRIAGCNVCIPRVVKLERSEKGDDFAFSDKN
jgi:hypothetical protein